VTDIQISPNINSLQIDKNLGTAKWIREHDLCGGRQTSGLDLKRQPIIGLGILKYSAACSSEIKATNDQTDLNLMRYAVM
jgi:hypothetical protein